MVAKLLLSTQRCFEGASDAETASALADIYHDVRDGLGFRKDPTLQGAFPTDPYSHTPRHLGAQQPGMTGQVKEQVLTRFGELGVEVVEGCVRFAPRLVSQDELVQAPTTTSFDTADGESVSIDLEPGSLAFSYCQVPVVYREGEAAAVELEHTDGRLEHVDGNQLDRTQSCALFERRGSYRRVTVTIPTGSLYR
jgi:hypothetical protein